MLFFRKINRKLLRMVVRERYHMDKDRELGDEKMNALLEKVQNMVVSPQIARELGLDDDWKEKISPDFVKQVAETALKHEKTLKELSKY